MSVPNHVWDSMGSPCLTYLASYISSGGPSWFSILHRGRRGGQGPAGSQNRFTRASGVEFHVGPNLCGVCGWLSWDSVLSITRLTQDGGVRSRARSTLVSGVD